MVRIHTLLADVVVVHISFRCILFHFMTALTSLFYFSPNPDIVLGTMPNSTKFTEYQKLFADEERRSTSQEGGEGAEHEGGDERGGEAVDGAGERAGGESDEKGGVEADVDNMADGIASTTDDDMFFQTASQPLPTRISKRRNRSRPRLKQDPQELTYTGSFDIFDFAAQERHRKIQALINEDKVAASAVNKPRGRKMGKVGDVFLASEITTQRDKVEKEKIAKAKKKRETQSKKRDRSEAQKMLVTSLKKELNRKEAGRSSEEGAQNGKECWKKAESASKSSGDAITVKTSCG